MTKLGVIVATEDEFKVVSESLNEGCVSRSEDNRNFNGDKVVSYIMIDRNDAKYDLVLFMSGVGKVNATYTAAKLKFQYGCDAILNIGSAGTSTDLDIGQLVLIKNCVQYDVDITQFGYRLGELPNQKQYTKTNNITDSIIKKELEMIGIDYGYFDIASGDSFIDYGEYESRGLGELGAELVDMETAAICYVCEKMGIPFSAIRIVSDTLSNQEYTENNETILSKYKDIYVRIVKKLLKG